MNRILGYLIGLLAALAGFFKLKGDRSEAKAEAAVERAKTAETATKQAIEVIDNVQKANQAADGLNDPVEYQRLLDKYTRKDGQ